MGQLSPNTSRKTYMSSKSILVTGGAGYCGSRLVSQLLSRGHKVTVYDIMYFGNAFLPKDNPNLTLVEGDIRDAGLLEKSINGHDTVISLACISNDASFELDEQLSTSVNLDAFEPMVIAAKRAEVSRFIYASSSSVYGVSEIPDVKEDHPLPPLTLYNKYKGMCELLLARHTDDNFVGVTSRTATFCGYALRQRLDPSVNILTNHAINKNKITVFGDDQLRPNFHIQNYCDVVEVLLNAPIEKVKNEIFNVGDQKMSIMDIANLVRRVFIEKFPDKKDMPIVTTPSDDNRLYHTNSDKIKRVLGFQAKHFIGEAMRDLCNAFRHGCLPNSFDDDSYFNVRGMKRLQAV